MSLYSPKYRRFPQIYIFGPIYQVYKRRGYNPALRTQKGAVLSHSAFLLACRFFGCFGSLPLFFLLRDREACE